jgi:hypothetical protein
MVEATVAGSCLLLHPECCVSLAATAAAAVGNASGNSAVAARLGRRPHGALHSKAVSAPWLFQTIAAGGARGGQSRGAPRISSVQAQAWGSE